jgi:hypothetical protein
MSDEVVRPWDLFNKQKRLEAKIGEPAAKEVAAERLAICKACPHFRKFTQQCKLCTCHMPWKVTLAASACALPDPRFPGEDRKWEAIVDEETE